MELVVFQVYVQHSTNLKRINVKVHVVLHDFDYVDVGPAIQFEMPDHASVDNQTIAMNTLDVSQCIQVCPKG